MSSIKPASLLISFLLLIGSLPVFAGAQKQTAAQHDNNQQGVAEMMLAIEGEMVMIGVDTPAANFLSFSHAPADDAQKRLQADTLKALSDYKNFLSMNGADCSQVHFNVGSPFQQGATKSPAGFHIGYQLKCKDAAAIKEITFKLFEAYPGFEKVHVVWVTATGQGRDNVTKESAKLTLK